MTKLVIPQGLPGSGKSTYAYSCAAEDPRMVVVSLDGLREVLKGSRQQYHSAEEALRKEHREAGVGGLQRSTEERHALGSKPKATPQRPKPLTSIVVDTAMTMTRNLLRAGYSVVYDAQNLNPKGVAELQKLAEECNAEVEVVTMPALSLAELLERNTARPKEDQVPEEYLLKQYQTYTQDTSDDKTGKRTAYALKVSSGWLLFDTFDDAQEARKEVRTPNSPVKVTVDDTVNTIGYISGVNVFSETIPHGQRLYAGRGQKQPSKGNTLLESMVNNPNVRVVPVQGEENLFACNFTREAFSKGNWDEYSSIARGLFLDPQGQVVMRGFDKFFNIGENPENTLEQVLRKVEYPVRVERKENGFLGLVGVAKDSTTKSGYRLRFFSKSGNTDYSKLVEQAWARALGETPADLLDAIAKENVTLAFEVIDTENDKHIIPYTENRLVLLHCIANNRTFQISDPESVTSFFTDRPTYKVAQNEEQLLDLIAEAKDSLTSEGCVLYSANGYMAKVKSDRYLKVKSIRTLVENCVLRGTPLPGKSTPRVEAARRVLAQAKAQDRELKYYAPLLDTWKVDLTWVNVNTLGL